MISMMSIDTLLHGTKEEIKAKIKAAYLKEFEVYGPENSENTEFAEQAATILAEAYFDLKELIKNVARDQDADEI